MPSDNPLTGMTPNQLTSRARFVALGRSLIGHYEITQDDWAEIRRRLELADQLIKENRKMLEALDWMLHRKGHHEADCICVGCERARKVLAEARVRELLTTAQQQVRAVIKEEVEGEPITKDILNLRLTATIEHNPLADLTAERLLDGEVGRSDGRTSVPNDLWAEIRRRLEPTDEDKKKVSAFNLMLTSENPTVRKVAEKMLEGVEAYDEFVAFLRSKPGLK
jgi:hypothetical protein